MFKIENYILQNSENAILNIGSKCYSEAFDPSGKAKDKIIDKFDLNVVSSSVVVYKYIPSNKGENFNTDGDNYGFFASAPLAYNSRGRKNNSSHYFGFTFNTEEDFNPAYLIDCVGFLSKFSSASEGFGGDIIHELDDELQRSLHTENPLSNQVQFGDATVDSSLNEASIFHDYRALIVNAVDAITTSNLKKSVAIVAPDEDLSKIIRIIVSLLPAKIAKKVSFTTKLEAKESQKYIIYGINDAAEVRSGDDLVPENVDGKVHSLFASSLRGKTISILLAQTKERERASDEFIDSANEGLYHLHLEEVASEKIKNDKNNWAKLFAFFTQSFPLQEQVKNTVLIDILKSAVSSIEEGDKRFYEYKFAEDRVADICNYCFARDDTSLLELMFGHILTYGLATSKSPQEVTYLSNLFSLLMKEGESRIFLAEMNDDASEDGIAAIGESIKEDIENLIVMNGDNNNMDFSPFIELIIVFALENYVGSFNDAKRKLVDYIFPVLSTNYANPSISKAICNFIEGDNLVEWKYAVFELLCRNGFYVNIATTERDAAVICGKINQVVELNSNFERNKELYTLLKNDGVEDKYTRWLLSFIVAPFGSFEELCRINDALDDSTTAQVHEKTTLFLHQNPYYLNYTNANYLYDLYNNKYMGDLANNIAYEEEVKNKVFEIHEGKTLIDNANKDFDKTGVYGNRIIFFEDIFVADDSKSKQHATKTIQRPWKNGSVRKTEATSTPKTKQPKTTQQDQTPLMTLIVCAVLALGLYIPIYVFGRRLFDYSLAYLLTFVIANIVGLVKYSKLPKKTASKYLWIINILVVLMPLILFDITLIAFYYVL